jgi:pyruvate dehydrogenase E1 component alpha subunit
MRTDRDLMLDLYAKMLRIRHFELKLLEIFAARIKAGDFPGALHTYDGQEAVAVGVCSTLRNDDYVFSTHRGHGHALAKGVDVKAAMAELNGRATGVSRGFGGSMHLYDPAHGFMGTTGIVGGGLPLCLGTAYAALALGNDRVTVSFFGDGAQSQGSFHESLNMAAIMKLPIIYVCENNLYAATTHVSVNCSLENIADRAKAYGIPGVMADGNDVLAVREAAEPAVQRARQGEGPTLIECKTYRHRAHCMIIPEHRPRTEIKQWKERDPILLFAQKLVALGMATDSVLEAVEQQEKDLLEEAVRFMQESPLPSAAALEGSLWATPTAGN